MTNVIQFPGRKLPPGFGARPTPEQRRANIVYEDTLNRATRVAAMAGVPLDLAMARIGMMASATGETAPMTASLIKVRLQMGQTFDQATREANDAEDV